MIFYKTRWHPFIKYFPNFQLNSCCQDNSSEFSSIMPWRTPDKRSDTNTFMLDAINQYDSTNKNKNDNKQ